MPTDLYDAPLMRLEDLQYQYPESLVATEPQSPSRIAFVSAEQGVREIQKSQLLEQFEPGDVLVLNDTQVEKRRVFAGDLEILFVKALSDLEWEVLFPARDNKVGDQITLPGEVTMTLLSKGLPQKVKLSQAIGTKYFEQFGEVALPPYIQKARGERHARAQDETWYQTMWAKESGSAAAPTASLHFSNQDLEELKSRGVHIVELTLHVGIGTFLPIKTEKLDDHVMHQEFAYLSGETIATIKKAKHERKRVWALGTTVTRALESWAQGKLSTSESIPEHQTEPANRTETATATATATATDGAANRTANLQSETENGSAYGQTDLFIRPGYEFQVVTDLLTNFHQPGSTLLALVSAFAGLEKVKSTYAWAIENKFRLFSYGDLSVWRSK